MDRYPTAAATPREKEFLVQARTMIHSHLIIWASTTRTLSSLTQKRQSGHRPMIDFSDPRSRQMRIQGPASTSSMEKYLRASRWRRISIARKRHHLVLDRAQGGLKDSRRQVLVPTVHPVTSATSISTSSLSRTMEPQPLHSSPRSIGWTCSPSLRSVTSRTIVPVRTAGSITK